jgi:HopJ type III effector protein
MKFNVASAAISAVAVVAVTSGSCCQAFSPVFGGDGRAAAAAATPTGRCRHHQLFATIRDKSDKSQELRFGWDGSTALGGAVEQAKPARMLDEIRSSGETIPDECEIFNANVGMDAESLTFEEVMDLIDVHYETGLIEFKNGNVVNGQGENEGSAKLLSYAALSQLDEATTLKLWGQYYREVLKDPDGDSHQNIRNFMKTGWKGEFCQSSGGNACSDLNGIFACTFCPCCEDEEYNMESLDSRFLYRAATIAYMWIQS